MSNNKKPMTDEQREAKRVRDAKYRAAKKAAKVVAQKSPAVAKKPVTVEKPTVAKKTEANPATKKVAKPVKTQLPKVQTAEVEPVRIHTIKPGDVIRFEGFSQERILDYANRLIMSVGYDRMTKMMEVISKKQKICKSCKK